ncbi:zinc dependent phospholipase C family protein [Clostridium sp. 'White wine YQ']|uniref:zinc dependent phospholipase C family protein n=1 Tax=Clostridium sp. 'White wine YQ' TaxID=3027474 RepID=UPI0023652602|nr:zinc dependent phospholipase C family protein [Clostridium sp. 'White wine YQ']MDD7793009.1 zinc dependent phospholipase C family protein [Clostridium sp. 'White wine YQ']
MVKRIENAYGKVVRGVFFAVNPIKKVAVKTTCIIHKFINIQSIQILHNEGELEAWSFYKEHIRQLNAGVKWADSDFKSSNHFFHYEKEKGLYGLSNALSECEKYHKMSLEHLKKGELEKALFYLGAACHLLQDSTVPHHVNNKLLKKHREFELWIISKLFNDYDFTQEVGIIRNESVRDYIKKNAIFANATHEGYRTIENKEERYYLIASEILSRAQKTTAGFLLDFYNKNLQNRNLQHRIPSA